MTKRFTLTKWNINIGDATLPILNQLGFTLTKWNINIRGAVDGLLGKIVLH